MEEIIPLTARINYNRQYNNKQKMNLIEEAKVTI